MSLHVCTYNSSSFPLFAERSSASSSKMIVVTRHTVHNVHVAVDDMKIQKKNVLFLDFVAQNRGLSTDLS